MIPAETGSSLPPGPARVSPWREARVAMTEMAAIAAILALTIKGELDGHFALVGILAVLMRSLTPFVERAGR